MAKFHHGMDGAIEMVIGGIVVVALIRSFLGIYNLDYLIIIFDVISIIAILFLF